MQLRPAVADRRSRLDLVTVTHDKRELRLPFIFRQSVAARRLGRGDLVAHGLAWVDRAEHSWSAGAGHCRHVASLTCERALGEPGKCERLHPLRVDAE